MQNVVISFDWAPQIGGAHHWLHEVYSRWPYPTTVLSASNKDDLSLVRRQAEYDSLASGCLKAHRLADPLRNIALLSPCFWTGVLRDVNLASALGGNGRMMMHALRAFPEGFVGLLAKRRSPRQAKLVTYAHGEEVLIAQASRALTWMARTVYGGSDLIVANSESTRAMVTALYPGAAVTVIHPGVDVASFAVPLQSVRQMREGWQWPSGTVVISTVSRMEPRKNQRAVIEAVAQLHREDLPVGYVCAGDGQERGALMELARTLAVADWVRFPGEISDSDKRLLLVGSDVYAMPSIQVGEVTEGFGIVFLEAAAAGIPSVSGNAGGQAEAVLDGLTGLVVDGTDTNEVSHALRRLTTDPEMRRELASNGKRWALEHDWSHVLERTLSQARSLSCG